MCRHVGYVGPDVRLDRVLLGLPHSLLVQSYAAKELLDGVVAADGFGVAWYRDEVGATPAVYRSLSPIWADRSFQSVAGHTLGHTVVANVRNATEVGTNDESNVHPFDHGRYTFSHNGYVSEFRIGMMRHMRTMLSDDHYALLSGVTESETIFRRILTLIDEGATARKALLQTAEEVKEMANERALVAQLNLLFSDGTGLFATRAGNRPTSNSLYTTHQHPHFPGAALVASEPLDDGPWTAVPDQHLVVLHAGEPPEIFPL